jgi:hypothetical protein
MAPTSPPQVGIPLTKDSLNAKLGSAASSVRKANSMLLELTEVLAPYTAADMEALGFTTQEAELFLSCLRGPTEAPALATTTDGFQFLSRVWGA